MGTKDLIETHQLTWKTNHETIVQNYLDYFIANNKAPNSIQLSDITGISRQTVAKHLQAIELSEVSNVYKKEVVNIIQALTLKAKSGDIQAIKLWLQVVTGFSEKRILESTENKKILQISFTGNQNDAKKIIDKLNENTTEPFVEIVDAQGETIKDENQQ